MPGVGHAPLCGSRGEARQAGPPAAAGLAVRENRIALPRWRTPSPGRGAFARDARRYFFCAGRPYFAVNEAEAILFALVMNPATAAVASAGMSSLSTFSA